MVKIVEERFARRVLLGHYYGLEGIRGGFRLRKLPEDMAKEIERLVGPIGGEVLLYPNLQNDDILYDVVVVWEEWDEQYGVYKLDLSQKKEMVKALYEATKPFWSQYTLYRLF